MFLVSVKQLPLKSSVMLAWPSVCDCSGIQQEIHRGRPVRKETTWRIKIEFSKATRCNKTKTMLRRCPLSVYLALEEESCMCFCFSSLGSLLKCVQTWYLATALRSACGYSLKSKAAGFHASQKINDMHCRIARGLAT